MLQVVLNYDTPASTSQNLGLQVCTTMKTLNTFSRSALKKQNWGSDSAGSVTQVRTSAQSPVPSQFWEVKAGGSLGLLMSQGRRCGSDHFSTPIKHTHPGEFTLQISLLQEAERRQLFQWIKEAPDHQGSLASKGWLDSMSTGCSPSPEEETPLHIKNRQTGWRGGSVVKST